MHFQHKNKVILPAEASKVAANQSFKLATKEIWIGALSTTDLVIVKTHLPRRNNNYLQANT